jgi:predicted DNA-binding transcriptional regulator AlpA
LIAFYHGDLYMKSNETEQTTAIATRAASLVPLDTNPPAVTPPADELNRLVGGGWVRVRGGAGAKPETEKPLIDVKEFAAKLGCCPKHIRRMADAGRCPPSIQLGGLHRWNRQVVDDWIAAGCPVVRHVRVGGRK